MSVNPIITGGSPLVTTVSHLKWNISNPQNTTKILEPVIRPLSKKLRSFLAKNTHLIADWTENPFRGSYWSSKKPKNLQSEKWSDIF